MQNAAVDMGRRPIGPGTGQAAERLLAAAEGIVLGPDLNALSIRAIASAAGVNSALISYHFGGLEALLARVAELNVAALCDTRTQRMQQAKQVPGKAQRLEALVAGFVEPLWQTQAIWHPGPARTVIRALVPRLSAELRRDAVQRINRNLEEASGPLLQALPHLDRDTLQVRLQLLAGAADELRLRARDLGLFPLRGAVDGGHEQALQRELLAMSLATLKMKPSVPGNGGQTDKARSNTLGEPGKRSAR